ncbi:hypothetical protein FGG08_005564 [Glutinoglossum americanum]|uniref:Uncharacterized protein n=1 Tax=Glutinoglossum americanum TaxID=1670608 RepID=A0A9P8I3B9_9PEZI|nr:hypothetical protein FGG08_005564 [Glutinoglossum americanum]
MAPLNSTLPYNASDLSGLSHGWMPQPQGRGTFSILWSGITTIFLCSWTVLCLNIPEPGMGRWGFLGYKLRWQLFAIIFPEVIAGMAAEQWASANQSVQKFRKLGYPQWTMRHAFFADMGGFMLESPDVPPFPVDGEQLAYLIERKYLQYPIVHEETIWDRNKADGFARLVTSVQITWFFIQCLARWAQGLSLSTLEITTFATIVATLNSLYFWYHKPLDVETPIILRTDSRIANILIDAGDRAREPYSRTPLDFLKSPPVRTSLVAPFWFGMGVVVNFEEESRSRPIRRFGNCKTRPPAGITIQETIYGLLFEFVYFGIHLVGWNQLFPTRAELCLWRVSSLVLLGLLITYLITIVVGIVLSRPVSRRWLAREVDTPLEVAAQLPRWAQLIIHVPILSAYLSARAYILLEGFISLRDLPLKTYVDITWTNFLPHL